MKAQLVFCFLAVVLVGFVSLPAFAHLNTTSIDSGLVDANSDITGKPDTSYADTLKVINCRAQAGSEVAAPVWLTNSFPVKGFDFRIGFNDSVLIAVGSSRGSRIDYFANFVPQWGSNWYRIWGTASGFFESNPPLSPGSDTLAFISFLVDSNANKGSYSIKFEADPDHSPPMYNALTDTFYNMIFPVCVAGTLKVDASGGIVEGQSVSDLPKAFSLAQNCPNPFNPVTQVGYTLPVDCWVKLEIYNIFGQKVSTLADGNQQAGYKVARWDASSFSSGIYFYRLKAGDFVQTRKMVVIR